MIHRVALPAYARNLMRNGGRRTQLCRSSLTKTTAMFTQRQYSYYCSHHQCVTSSTTNHRALIHLKTNHRVKAHALKIVKRNYIFFETKNTIFQFKQTLDSILSKFGIDIYSSSPSLGSSLMHRQRPYKLQRGRKVMIHLKSNKDKMKHKVKAFMKQQRPKFIQRLVNARVARKGDRLKFKQWNKSKRSHLVHYYRHNQALLRIKSNNWIHFLRSQKTLIHLHTKNKLKRTRGVMNDFIHLYNNNNTKQIPFTIDEPFSNTWFSKDGGYPLTAKDPRTGRFVNPWNSESTNGWKRLGEVWRWKKSRIIGYDFKHGVSTKIHKSFSSFSSNNTNTSTSSKNNSPIATSIPMQLAPPSSSKKIKVTWVGQSTMLIQQSGFTILTDPVFSNKASPVQYFEDSEFLGVPRLKPPSFQIDDIPPAGVDICLISHDHYDHLDYNSILQLTKKNLIRYWVVPLGMKEWLMKEANVEHSKIVELEWWQSAKFYNESHNNYFSNENQISLIEVTEPLAWTHSTNDNHNNEIVVTCAPAQHWSSRSPFDRNTRLWASWAIHSKTPQYEDMQSIELSFYFAGDTGYPKFPLFRQIGDNLGPFDLAAIPIGCYKPRFFMHDSHCDPAEALKIHQDVRSTKSLGIHWGTFPLANEPFDEPIELLRKAVDLEHKKGDNGFIDFTSIPHGDTIESVEGH